MAWHNRDLLAACGLALAGLAVQLVPVPGFLHVAAGALLVVVCPGYALTALWFPQPSLGSAERAALTLALSMAVAILGAVAFNLAPWGVSTVTVTALSFGSTVAGSLAAAWRRGRAADVPQAAPGRPLPDMLQWTQLGLAALVVLAAILLVRVPRPADNVTGYTVLAMAPAQSGASSTVSLAVVSGELATTHYTLIVSLDGQTVQQWPDLALTPGEHWQQTLASPPARSGGVLQAKLYKAQDPTTVYRSTSLVLNP